MQAHDWYYDDLRQVGVDFDDQATVAEYDRRQTNSIEKAERLIERLDIRSDDEIADIGCGPGLFACAAAYHCRKVNAIDVSRAMLSMARQRASALRLGNVVFHHSGFLSFEFDDASLDLVTTTFALHHLPDFWKAIAIARIRRALKPGGRLYLKDVVFSCAPDMIPDTVERWTEWMMANTGYSREDVACHVREEHSTFGWIMEGLIEAAGLRLVSTKYEQDVYAEYVAERPAV